jgi:hypothetical protein
MILDLDKASKALNGLKTDEGSKALEELHSKLEGFRKSLGVELNDAEFRYVMQTLFNEQVVTVPAEEAKRMPGPTLLNHGFTVRAVI